MVLGKQNRIGVMACFFALIAAIGLIHTSAAAEPRHERIDKAKQALDDAYADLKDASDDFNGHKKEAMEKIDLASKALDQWHEHKNEAKEKMNKALEELHVCKEKGRVRHPRIEAAIDAVEAAKDELKD